MGRKKVQSNPYCLQCWHNGGSESVKMSHLFEWEDRSARGWRLEFELGNIKSQGKWEGSQIVAREERPTDRILRLRQLSQALWVLVRFFASGGSEDCVLALGPDPITPEVEPDGPAISSPPSASPSCPSSVSLRLRLPVDSWAGEGFTVEEC